MEDKKDKDTMYRFVLIGNGLFTPGKFEAIHIRFIMVLFRRPFFNTFPIY